MISEQVKMSYLSILRHELFAALGCTEPIAIAYAAAKAREVLGCIPEHIDLACSGNIIKNVKAVIVPHSGGAKGMDVAAVLGAVGGDPNLSLQVLESVTEEDCKKAMELLQDPGYCVCRHLKGEENLDIIVTLFSGNDRAEVEIKTTHTNIVRIEKNGELLYTGTISESKEVAPDKTLLNVKDILEFCNTVEIERIKPLLKMQMDSNRAISEEGMRNTYGLNVGNAIIDVVGDTVMARACALAAAGSDARMNGCDLPVVINSGSGNQGITVTMPVVVYAQEYGVSEEKMYRALAFSNLLAIHQKRFIGSLSAYCGAVSAGCASGAAITYMSGGDYDAICRTITNALATTGGIVCDGAKSSCAAKIATSVGWAIMSHKLSMKGRSFLPDEGLVGHDVEETIANYGRMAKYGMQSTDEEILSIMVNGGSAT